MDLKDIKEVLDLLGITFGPYLGTLLFITLVIIVCILAFFKKRMENIADEISQRSINKFNALQELSIRNEVTRKELVLYQAQKSFDKQIEIYTKVYKQYFEYQKSWVLVNDVNKNEIAIQEIWNHILELRREIFLSSIFLGGELTEYLISAVIAMWNILEGRLAKAKYIRLAEMGIYRNENMDFLKNEIQLGEYLDKAQKYLMNNLHTYQNISQYDFTDEQKKILESEKNNIFKEVFCPR